MSRSEEHPAMRIALAFQNHASDLECILDLDGQMRWFSPGWVEVLGWSADELLGVHYERYIHPDDIESSQGEVRSFHEVDHRVIHHENRFATKDGSYRWLSWSAVRQDDEVLCRVRDITPSKEFELSAKERLSWLELSVSLGKVGYWRYSLADSTMSVSSDAFRQFAVDGDPTSLYHPADQPRARAALEQAIAEKGDFEHELRMQRRDGAIRLVQTLGCCELSARGEVVALYGIFSDVTDQRRMEESLRQTERMASLGTLSSAVAHEINNPLTYILANIDLLTGELSTTATRDQFEMLVEARRGAEQVRKIVSGLKAFSRMGSDNVEAIDVTETIDVALRMVGNELRHKAAVEVNVSELPPVNGDQSELLQVLSNILVNAAQAIPADAKDENTIVVEARLVDGQIEVSVTDSGVGLPDENRGRIFEPFFTTKPQGVGTGLGLSVSIGIVERMGGTIELGPAPVKGTRARISLPTAEQMPATPSSPTESTSRTRTRILLIDDDERVGRAMKRMLARSYDVEIFADGREALDYLKGNDVDLVLCDLMMPGFSGIQLYREARAELPSLVERLVFITGGAFGTEARSFLESITNPVLEKPIDFQALHNLVQERCVDDVSSPVVA